MDKNQNFLNYLKEKQEHFDISFRELLLSATSLKDSPPGLNEAILYSLFASKAKRIRPIICLEAAQLSGLPSEKALLIASSLELLHTYSLIHDDLPALDNDDWRRGQLASHKKFGEAVAILAGDALQSLAFECLALAQLPLECIYRFALAIGPAGMVAGQFLDIQNSQSPNPALLKTIHRKKTGYLFEASFVLPFVPFLENLKLHSRFGAALGKMFQIADDLLDATGNIAELGKAVQKDKSKLTYISLYGVEKTQRILHRIGQRLVRFAQRHFPQSEFFAALPIYLATRRT